MSATAPTASRPHPSRSPPATSTCRRAPNSLPATGITVVKDRDGTILDATDVVARYLESLPGKTVTRAGLQLDRIRLLNPLPAAVHGVREVQPLGAVAR